MQLSVFIPKGPSAFSKGTALVGRRVGDGPTQVMVCSRARDRGHRDIFADRVREAAQLLLSGRTVSARRETIEGKDLLEVAFWDDERGVVILIPSRTNQLSSWIGHPVSRCDLEATDSAFSVQQKARQDMRRAYIQGRPDRARQIASEHNIRGW